VKRNKTQHATWIAVAEQTYQESAKDFFFFFFLLVSSEPQFAYPHVVIEHGGGTRE
jgi:hypothetical protein